MFYFNEINNTEIEMKLKLQQILNLSKCNHKLEIIKQPNIKYAHIYCKINQLSGQETGPLVENYIKEHFDMKKNKASLCIGDLQYNQTNYEIKVSTGGKDNNKFNYVQLRINHSCEYILTAYYINDDNIENMGELFIFKLKKSELKYVILNYGGYAHGTMKKLGPVSEEDLENEMNDKEYAIRPKYGDKCWCYLLKFRIDEFSIQTN
jgi:hypothetical protein